MNEIKTIILDYGGILGKYGYLQDELSNNENEKESWYNYVKTEFKETFIGRNINLFIQKSAEFFKEDFEIHKEKIIKLWTEPNFEVLDFIKTLKNKYKIILLTNNARGIIVRFIQNNSLENFFDSIIDSSEVKMLKKDKEIYEFMIKKCDLNPKECLFIDDILENLEIAQKLNFHTLLFKDFNQFKLDFEEIMN